MDEQTHCQQKTKKKQHLEMRGIEPRTNDHALCTALPIELHPHIIFNLQYN